MEANYKNVVRNANGATTKYECNIQIKLSKKQDNLPSNFCQNDTGEVRI
jgi:hypothetical protein